MNSIVETSLNSMAADLSRSKLSTAGHGRSRKYLRKPFRYVCNVPGSYSSPWFYFVVSLISGKKCLKSCRSSCFEIHEINLFAMFFLKPRLQMAHSCSFRIFFFVFSETILSLIKRDQFKIIYELFHIKKLHIRDQFVICIGQNGLLFRIRCLTFFGIDTCSVFVRGACLVFLGKNFHLVFFPRLDLPFFFFFSMPFLFVLLSVSGILRFSKKLNFNSKFGRHSFSVRSFISKAFFFS